MCEEFPDGGKIILKLNVSAVRLYPSRWLDESKQYEEKLSTPYKNLVELMPFDLFNVDSATLGILKCPGKFFPGDFVMSSFYSC